MIHGKNLLIYEGRPASVIAACISCSISSKSDVMEISSPANGDARTYKAGRVSWEVSVSTFVLTMKDYLLRKGKTYFLILKDRNNSDDIITGSAICTNVQIVATKGNLVQGSLQFVGLDDIIPPTPGIPSTDPDFNEDFNEDYLIG